jgi:hypothetical protein
MIENLIQEVSQPIKIKVDDGRIAYPELASSAVGAAIAATHGASRKDIPRVNL